MSKQTAFTWTGISFSGKKIAGQLIAKNKKDVLTKLSLEQITVLHIEKKRLEMGRTRFSHKDRLDFTQQLHLLLQAGVPLTDSLSLIATHSPDQHTQQMIFKLRESIMSGGTFANALRLFPKHFNELFCQMITIAEQSGQLEFALSELIQDLEMQAMLRGKLSKVLFYPITVLCIAIIISIGLLIFVLPEFNAIYNSFGAQLPTTTKSLISLSASVKQHGFCILFFIFFIIYSFLLFFKKNGHAKNNLLNLFFQIKPYRSLYMTKYLAQWSRLMGMMLTAGIPLIETLAISNHIILQPSLQKEMREVQELVIAGKPLHLALAHCPYFPKRAIYLISIGENADGLNIMMKKIAEIYQKRFDSLLDHLSKLLEPVIMILVAGFISFLIIALYLPIFRMGSVI